MAFICFAFLLLTLVPASHSVNYAWNLYPIANKALYGYVKAANKSFKSAAVPDGVKTQTEDGIRALYVPAGKEIDLGDFAGTCVSNTTKCQNFSVSFLLKPQGDKSVKIFDSGMRYGRTEEWGWLFEIYSDGDFNAMVGHENSLGSTGGKPASVAEWLHIGFTYDSSNCCSGESLQVFLNGSQTTGPSSASSPMPQDKVTRLKLASKDNKFGFFIRDFQFLEMKLNAQDIQKLGNATFAKALQAYNVSVVEVLTASVAVRGNAGKVQIPLQRTANVDVAVPVGFNITSDTAIATKHFNPPANQQLAFAPGEIYKHLEVGIVDDKAATINKTFKITFNSPEDWVVLNGPMEVEVTVIYSSDTSGSTGTAPSVEGKMFLVLCTMLLFVRSFVVAV